MSDIQIQLNNISQGKGVSYWLISDVISKHGFSLNKQQFWDGIRIRYGWELTNIPSICACGHKMDMQHAISCKKGGFIRIMHKDAQDLTCNLLTIICKGVEIEPKLLPVTGEAFDYQTANTSNKARVVI